MNGSTSRKRCILGIDPGSRQLGYGIITQEQDLYCVQQAGTIALERYDNYVDKISCLIKALRDLFKQFSYQEIAIEDAFYAKNAQSMLKLGRIQGAVLTVAAYLEVSGQIYSPSTIKLAIGGTGRSSKEQVASMLQYQVKEIPNGLSTDATDAISVALCHALRTQKT